MKENRVFVLVSMPKSFAEKYFGLINNLNMTNSDKGMPVEIENVYEGNYSEGVVINDDSSNKD